MGFKEAMIPMVFFVICICGIAITSIVIKTYLEENKEKDANFNFSALILTVSLIGLFASGYFAYKAYKGGANASTYVNNTSGGVNNATLANAGATAASEVAGSNTNIGAQEKGLANKLENVAANAETRASKAREGAKLANALGATLNQLKNNKA